MSLFAAAKAAPPEQTKPMYNERYRPQFHFTPATGWHNDPNGCVYFDGEYHLFFQHNPHDVVWGNMTWGHAVSSDLLHWQQLPLAIEPYGGGTIFSGSAVVDERNSAGFAAEHQTAMVAAFTHAKEPFGQAIAFSTDRGRSWTLYQEGRPVVPNQGLDPYERDPKLLWYAPGEHWVMVIWAGQHCARILTSRDLKQWHYASDFKADGFYECPDLFPLAANCHDDDISWVLHDGAFTYWVGKFDGRTFRPSAGPLRSEFGENYYASQSWNHCLNRTVQIAWMRGGAYPGMPFSQQMSFPCELRLEHTSAGPRLYRYPIDDLARLWLEAEEFQHQVLEPGESLTPEICSDLLDVDLRLAVDSGSNFEIRVHHVLMEWSNGQLHCLGKQLPMEAKDGVLQLRILLDRTSLELFANQGEATLSACILPDQQETHLTLTAAKRSSTIDSLSVGRLRSIWPADEEGAMLPEEPDK